MPFLYPASLYDQLEFSKILTDLATRCIGEPARKKALNLSILTNISEVEVALDAIISMLALQDEGIRLSISEYRDLEHAYQWLEVVGSTLPIKDILEIRNQLSIVSYWHKLFDQEKRRTFAPVYRILAQAMPLDELLDSMQSIFDEEGEIKDSASPELRQIRQAIKKQERGLQKAFNQALEMYRQKGYLVDNFETMRNGRRVLAVQAEHKRKISGLILDESTTGKTVFIQPSEAIQIENELFDVRNDERREINHILKELTGQLQSYHREIKNHQIVISGIDLVRAKGSQARALSAQKPHLRAESMLQIKEGRHPLLILKHPNDPEAVVPFDLAIGQNQQIVVISGPNAGGKSITLKAVGLLALMCQSGLLIPADSDSTVGIYEGFMGDIGDQQSIEQDLSTYTSHLQNMQHFLSQANAKTLFLIDEFGSGTEPAIGGAIAESILRQLLKLQSQGVITTHYGNLKILAANTQGIVNASMAFDRTALRPTYQFELGTPGSSFAFEMADRSGLPKSVINRARHKMGRKEGQLEYLLTNLQKEKQELEQKLRDIERREKDLDRLVRTYEKLQAELDIRRKKLRMEEKTMRLQEQSRATQQLDKLIKELREKEKLASAKELAKELKKDRVQLSNEIAELQENIVAQKPHKKSDDPLAVGDSVRMKIGGMTGTIHRIQRGKATVLVGNMKLDAALSELEHARTPIEVNPIKSVHAQFKPVKAHTKLDIRGLRRSESLNRLEKFVDQALMADLSSIEIIHGKGNGTLKQAVQDKLREYDQSFESYHPQPEHGGDGVTVVKLR